MSTPTKHSNREQAHAEILKEALSRPGVHEAMQVYRNWPEKNQNLKSYRSAIQKPPIITTTNSSSIS